MPEKFSSMKKAFFLLFLWAFFACGDNSIDNQGILPNVPVNETVYLNLPENTDLLVPGGWVYHKGGISGLIIYHVSQNNYLAYERAAPHLEPQACSRMFVENGTYMVCPCDESKFSILNGGPLTDGIKYAARQYRVIVNGNSLIITNY